MIGFSVDLINVHQKDPIKWILPLGALHVSRKYIHVKGVKRPTRAHKQQAAGRGWHGT